MYKLLYHNKNNGVVSILCDGNVYCGIYPQYNSENFNLDEWFHLNFYHIEGAVIPEIYECREYESLAELFENIM